MAESLLQSLLPELNPPMPKTKFDGMNMPLATRQAVNAHRTDVLALNREMWEAIKNTDIKRITELAGLYDMVAAEMGRTTGATTQLPSSYTSVVMLDKKCAKCGEYWPCSDSKRTDINPLIRAEHTIA